MGEEVQEFFRGWGRETGKLGQVGKSGEIQSALQAEQGPNKQCNRQGLLLTKLCLGIQ